MVDNQDPTITCPTDLAVSVSSCTTSVILFESFNTGSDGWVIRSTTGGVQPTTLTSPAFGTPNNGPELGVENSFLQSPIFDTTGGAEILYILILTMKVLQGS